MTNGTTGFLRIGELSQRTGVSPELLRAWQRRYGLLEPERSPGGFRLYSDADEARVRRMQELLGQGVSAAEAARLATQTETGPSTDSYEEILGELGRALESFDEAGGHRVLDRALAAFSLDAVIGELLLPYLHDLGERWTWGEITVAQEHFASNLIRARLLALARSWDAGYGPRALLACPEGELHDLGLVLFGVALARRGWRITFLGANTPVASLVAVADEIQPDAVVVSSSEAARLNDVRDGLFKLARSHRLILAGAGASEVSRSVAGAELFETDPVTAADRLAATR